MCSTIRKSALSKMMLLLALLMVAMLAFASCARDEATPVADEGDEPPAVEDQVTTEDDDDDDDEDTTDEAPPEATVGGTLIHVGPSESPFMDPIRQNDSATSDLTSQVFEGLVKFLPYPYNEITPLLAYNWTQLDELTWEFNLRQGVYFHDGSYFTADAWRLSIERLLDPREASPGAFILAMIDHVVAVDDYTVHIVLEFEYTPLLGALTHMVAFSMSREALAREVMYRVENFEPCECDDEDCEEAKDYPLHPWQEDALAYAQGRGLNLTPSLITHEPRGTGPFEVVYRVGGDYTRLRANDNHWRARPNLDYVIFQVVPDAATRFAMLQTGEANTLALQPVDVAQMEVNPHLQLTQLVGTGIDYIGFNMQRGPLADVRVRHALTMGLNRYSVIAAAFEGLGQPAVGPLGPNVLHSPAAYLEALPFDPDRARELLEEAGFGDGLSLSLWANEGNAARGVMAEIAQAYWAQIGVDISIEIIEWGAYLRMTGEGEHDMFILGWTTVTGDADYGMYSLFTTHNWGPPGNRTFYSNPEVDRLLTEGRRATDFAERDRIYREAVALVIEDAPWIFVRNPLSNWGTNGVEGFALNFNFTPYFYLMSLTD